MLSQRLTWDKIKGFDAKMNFDSSIINKKTIEYLNLLLVLSRI